MRKGFTLIEFLIYLALVGTVVTSLSLWVLSLADSRNRNYATTEVETNAEIILDWFNREVKQASAVVVPTALATSTTLELDRPGTAPNLIFRETNGTMELVIVGGSVTPISSPQVVVRDLVFRHFAPAGGGRSSVGLHFVLGYRAADSADFRRERVVDVTVGLRP
ncbi:MAG: type II secretion system protein [Patescibacteria group bacterium]